MTTYKVVFERAAERAFQQLPGDVAQQLDRAILGLATDPRPAGCEMLKGYADLYRIRVSDWRIVYAIQDDELTVLVVEIMPHGERIAQSTAQRDSTRLLAIFNDLLALTGRLDR